ncbi:MAG TPA: alcohol dehydrogenase catalytic domain-containing protein [Nitrososphaeraceae archaeon]|jgi:L-iditol 2-dehydrogenase|nr:alcohol dehydrogenase catalytic domain-containing protein [Nitrososphaeraceae archaeon]
MKALELSSDKTISLVEIDEPIIKDKEILINLGSCGICGSDLRNVFADSCKPTSKLGHEITGTIVKVGKSFNGRNYEGKRVFVNHHAPCNSCHYCIHGNETMCDKFTDNIFPCGISEKIILSEWIVNNQSIFELPDSMSFEEGSMIEPLACCIRGWKKLSFVKGDSVLIFGIGPIGILHAMLAKIYGASAIYCVDINQNKVDFCKKMNLGICVDGKTSEIESLIDLNDRLRPDLIIIATYDMTVLPKSVDIIRKGGTILIFGEPQKEINVNVDINKIYSKEVRIKTTYAATNEEIQEALHMITKMEIDVNKIITHRYSILESKDAFKKVHDRNDVIKAIIINQ